MSLGFGAWRWSWIFGAVVCGWAGSSGLAQQTGFGAQAGKTNIVLILADDLAWSDLGCYGHPWHETPHLNALARDGLGFTDAYAPAPICSASRASILTGKAPARLHFEFVTKDQGGRQATVPRQPLQAPPYALNLPLEERTLGEMLTDAGYATAFFGKWHVNAHFQRYLGWSPNFGPGRQGFATAEEDFGSHPYSYGGKKPAIISTQGEFPADSMTKRASDFVKLPHRRPFFLMLSLFYVQTPVETPCLWLVQKYRAKIPADAPNRDKRIVYAACVETLDHQVGEVLKALDEAGQREKTLVVFTSDNGGHPVYAANAPWRGSKWNLYEGGIRVPFLVRWPGRVPAGEPCRTPVCGFDLYPTFAEVAGKPVAGNDPKVALDGRSLVPLFAGPTTGIDRALYWHFPYYHPEGEEFGKAADRIGMDDFAVSQTRPVSAMRRGKYKLLHFLEDDRVELYNLDADRGETIDLATTEATEAEGMKAELQKILKGVKARMPEGMIIRQ